MKWKTRNQHFQATFRDNTLAGDMNIRRAI